MEWGNSAVAVILTLFMMMVLVVYAVLYLLFSRLEVTGTWMKSLREKGTGKPGMNACVVVSDSAWNNTGYHNGC